MTERKAGSEQSVRCTSMCVEEEHVYTLSRRQRERPPGPEGERAREPCVSMDAPGVLF